MTPTSVPSDAPPSYDAAATAPARAGSANPNNPSSTPSRRPSLIPAEDRRSMEDLGRPLPEGWVRQYDPRNQHHFYVDTTVNPPRSIWEHPLDDEQYASHAGNEDVQSGSKPAATGVKKFGQTMKNKMTGTTHAERVEKRRKQREAEEEAYRQHQAIRAALHRAAQTGQPQLLGRDQRGRDIFAQPPPSMDPYAGPCLGYTPYQTETAYPYGPGSYAAPYGPYRRRPGYAYGGGMGLPIAGGLMGGLLLGGLLF
ncbi:WW domain [Ceraceosorus bombacis]|uniref:WW domain n=1 Tax=Ceraceosorus bombacis TaxID=401625 RepID=A0A0P1B9A4_9BASI|nr:WW domain [Ceraceosorus bombacis]